MEQLLLHLLGDYLLQNDWMAANKGKKTLPAFIHALVYSLPFLLLGSYLSVWVIFVTHFFIDRFGLIKYLTYALSFTAPKSYWKSWSECSATGFHKDKPVWLAVWIMIICDNFLHLLINFLSLKYL